MEEKLIKQRKDMENMKEKSMSNSEKNMKNMEEN